MSSRFNRRAAFERAAAFLADGTPESLRYACLELRLCLEDMTYQKLRLYSKRLPPGVLETWQPPQAVKLLLEFEPFADERFILRMSPESEPGVPTGEWRTVGHHVTLKQGLIRKYYNKLGSFLHLDPPARSARQLEPQELAPELSAILREMRPAVENHFDASFAPVVEWVCSICASLSVANEEGLRKNRRAFCLNPNCGAEYHVEVGADDELVLQPKVSYFPCHDCDEQIRLENRKLDVGLMFKCTKCGLEHTLVTREWLYGSNAPARENGG